MLSHLRFHRRGHSNLSSPSQDQPPTAPFDNQTSPVSPHPDGLPPDEQRPVSSSSSAGPPSLPPITRVTTDDNDTRDDYRPTQRRQRDAANPGSAEPRSPPNQRSPCNANPSFIGGVALQKYRRELETTSTSRHESGEDRALGSVESHAPMFSTLDPGFPVSQTSRPLPSASNTTRPSASFTMPTEVQSSSPYPATSRRPGALRLTSEPPMIPTSSSSELPKAKKGLPFLKNPMTTLLTRRKNAQNASDIIPNPQMHGSEEPAADPRIRGTRVHDFSAPRLRNKNNTGDATTTHSPSHHGIGTYGDRSSTQVTGQQGTSPSASQPPRQQSNASESARLDPTNTMPQDSAQPSSVSSRLTQDSVGQRVISVEGQAPPVPPKEDIHKLNARASQSSTHETTAPLKTTGSTTPSRSGNVSISDITQRESLSTIPRHMKSTSSRFSFDMIGSASQEKLLEERHRQRELERQTSETPGARDSRFDEFDDDSFDYEAMMDDDGLEERIPGVNADLEDDDEFPMDDDAAPLAMADEMARLAVDDGVAHLPTKDGGEPFPVQDEKDPDNDQQNFSGFVFQRSNPTSSVATPKSEGITSTPRDFDGQIIGAAMSRDAPNMQAMLPAQPTEQEESPVQRQPSGLGIHGMNGPTKVRTEDAVENTAEPIASVTDASSRTGTDDMYFDDGVLGLEDEFAEDLALAVDPDSQPFDESLFDLDDTDQFGRPLPGAFAQAQLSRQIAQHNSVKRDSDMTSRLSGQTGVSRSTAHTSLSINGKQARQPSQAQFSSLEAANGEHSSSAGAMDTSRGQASTAGYQAALAAAANAAAASGKFHRDDFSLPEIELDEQLLQHQGSGDEHLESSQSPNDDFAENLDDYEQEDYEDMDAFDLDDDAIIAEANASALANDCDGWYGHEFGFYSTPVNGSHGSHNADSSTSVDYEYSNGGFFGPKGMSGLDRSTSGRMVSREPNLTPITERSEYSNRNSLMSLVPPFGPGTPTIQSPGLAQLAMMSDRGDDQMSLSALLRLRSKAWGGSQASLVSSKDSSPRSDRGEGVGSFWKTHQGASTSGRKNSVYSTASRESEPDSAPGSPTLTSGIVPDLTSPSPAHLSGPSSFAPAASGGTDEPAAIISPQPQYMHTGILSPTAPEHVDWTASQEGTWANMPSRRSGMGHRHKSSADSISYMKEEESGQTRWVMERRRTGETGEVEILEREVVEGGRI